MATATNFDTHAYVKRLQETGVSEQQAEVHAQAMAEMVHGHLATKQDLKEQDARMIVQIKELDARMTVQFEEIKRDIKELDLAHKRDMKELELAHKRDMKELDLAHKGDMKELDLAHKGDMKELDLAHKGDMKDMELRLTVRLGAVVTVGIGVVAVLVKIL